MHFFNFIWLFSIAAISIPIIIHLWNVRPGKTLKVGSISIIESSSRKRSRSFNLLDLLLLLLRCAFLILLAFVLALPYLKQHIVSDKKSDWLLIPKENFKETYQKFKPKADSILKAGYELHYFDYGFQKITLQQALADTFKVVAKKTTSYWSLVKQLDRATTSILKAYLLTPGTLTNFSGEKPQIDLKLKWQTYTPADSTDSWIQDAWFTNNKNIHVIQGSSNPGDIFYTSHTINSATENGSDFLVNVNNGQPAIALKSSNQKPFIIDTANLTVYIYADNNNKLDEKYVRAALESVGQCAQRDIIIKPYNSYSEPATAKWLFWLSDKPLKIQKAIYFKNIFIYENGKTNNTDSWIVNGNKYSILQGKSLIALYKTVNAKYIGETTWHDGFGNPVLTNEVRNKQSFYHFYSRFNPGWSNLVWSNEFPRWMLQLVINSSSFDTQHDCRVITNDQAQPIFISQNSFNPGIHVVIKDITQYFWMVLALIFFIERSLSYKTTLNRKEIAG